MPRTILCQKCGVILNLPDRVTAGKKMKCPKCANRFEITERDANSASMPPGAADAAMASSHELPKRPPSQDELPLLAADHDLRDMFDSPLSSAAAMERDAASSQTPGLSDAEALFKDEPARRRKPKGAEARAQTRRCSRCGGVVPMGMSICVSCGVDQDTGLRVGLEDDLAPPAPPRSTGPPLHIAITGFLCGLTSVILLILALIQSVRGEAGVTQYGWLCLAVVSAVGIYGSVQFLMGKTPKFLMLALALGLFVNLMAMIALPIIQANFEEKERVVSRITQRSDDPGAIGDEDVEIKPIAERIDVQKIKGGLIITGIYVILSIYLMSPPVKKYFIRQTAMANVPIF
jgi:phage FluMu protein Com